MGSQATSRSLVGRSAAILTTGEVAGASLDLKETWGDKFTVDLDFTLGSLTNVVVRFYASSDGSTWKPLSINGTGVASETITANATRMYALEAPGCRFFRASVQGTGTVTSSSCAFTYRYLRRGSQ